MKEQRSLSAEQRATLLETLAARFAGNPGRHEGVSWGAVLKRLEGAPEKLWALHQMEETGGEPDVIGQDPATGEYLFCDCAAESPAGRRNLCYDPQALASRKENKPKDSALGMAEAMGVEILTEAQYRALQQLGKFDLKTSTWVLTPPEIRKLGGALFCDRRYEHVFTYHNGAESYYSSRGFRGMLKV